MLQNVFNYSYAYSDENNTSEDTTPTTVASAERVPYTACCRALLVGIGADEQMGGYGRHRTCYNRGGFSALKDELHLDQNRLWSRNLGRDDRCIADNGREAWFPYLDEEVVIFLQQLPLSKVRVLCTALLCSFYDSRCF